MAFRAAIAVFCLALLGAAAPSHAMVFENTRVALEFDSDFTLLRVEAKDEGFTVESTPAGSPIWHVTLLQTAAVSPIDWGTEFTRFDARAATGGVATTSAVTGGSQLQIAWSNVAIPGGDPTDLIDITLTVFLPDDSLESQWSAEVKLAGTGFSLWSFDGPILSLEAEGSGPQLDRASLPLKGGALVKNPATVTLMPLNPDETQGDSPKGSHPRDFEMQFVHLYEEASGQGLFFRTTDTQGALKRLVIFSQGGDLLLFARHYPADAVTPGLTYTTPYDVRLAPFVGDWYDGARFYRDFFLSLPAASAGPLETRSDFAGAVAETHHLSHTVDLNSGGNYPGGANAEASLTAWRDFVAPVEMTVHLRGLGPGLPETALDSTATGALLFVTSLELRSLPYTNSYAWPTSSSDDPTGTRASASVKTLDGTIAESFEFGEYRMDPFVPAWRDKYLERTAALLDGGATDQYVDLNPNFHFCFDASHGHPLGAGTHFMDGYRTQMQAVRALGKEKRADFSMLPEHRSELTVDLFDYFRLPYWTGDGSAPFVGGIAGAEPVPLVATVMHDHIGLAASTGLGSSYEQLGDAAFRFAQAYSFVQGNSLSFADLGHLMNEFSDPKLEAFEYTRSLLYHRAAATKFLLYGDILRPPTTGSGLRTVSFHGVDYQQPAVLGSVYGASDGTLGAVLVNDQTHQTHAAFRLDPSDYDLAPGTYEIHSLTPDMQTGAVDAQYEFYGGFRDAPYTRYWRFEPGEVLILEVRAAVDSDGDGMSDAWEVAHGLDPADSSDAAIDPDDDGLSNAREFAVGTDPALADSDVDGDSDLFEITAGSDPRDASSTAGASVPALGPPGLALLAGLMLGLGALQNRRRRMVRAARRDAGFCEFRRFTKRS